MKGLDFASNIIVELHSDDEKNFYVKVRSNGSYVKLLGRNAYQMPFSDFKLEMKKYTASNYEDVCGRPIHLKESLQEHPLFLVA